MGYCTVCGKNYCNCPGNGICPSCANKQIQQVNAGQTVYGEGCGMDSDKVTELRDFAISLKQGNKYIQMGLTMQTVDMYVSYAVSAWNYRHDPCMYKDQLHKIETLRKLHALIDKGVTV